MEVQNLTSFTNSKNLESLFNENNENSRDIDRKCEENWKTISLNKSNKNKYRFRGSWRSILKNEAPTRKLSKQEEWQSILKHDLPKKNWTKEEDIYLIEAVDRYGPHNWSLIAGHVKGRNGVSCRKRWVQQLDPNIKKTPWTDEENQIIIGAHRIWGNQWSRIARLLPGRTDNGIKNHWHVDLKFLCDQNVTTGQEDETNDTFRNHTALQKTLSNSELDEYSSNSTEILSPDQPTGTCHITKYTGSIKHQEPETKLEESIHDFKSSEEKKLTDSSNEVNLSTLSTSPEETLLPLSTLLSSLSRPEFSSRDDNSSSNSSIIQHNATLDNHNSSISFVNTNNNDESLSGFRKIPAVCASISEAESQKEMISKLQQMQQAVLATSLGHMEARWPQSLYTDIISKDSEIQSNSLKNSIKLETIESLRKDLEINHDNKSHIFDTFRNYQDIQASNQLINPIVSHTPLPAEIPPHNGVEYSQDIFNLDNNSFSSIISQLIKAKNETRSTITPPNFLGHHLVSPLSNINAHHNKLSQLFNMNCNPDPVSYSDVFGSDMYKSFYESVTNQNMNQNVIGSPWGNFFHLMQSNTSTPSSTYTDNGDILSNKHSSDPTVSPDNAKDIAKEVAKDIAKNVASQESSAQIQNEELSVTEFQRRLLDLILRAPDVLWKRKICWKLSEIVKLIDGIKEKEPSEKSVLLEKNIEVIDKSKSTNNHRHLEKWKKTINNIHQRKNYHSHHEANNSHQDLSSIIENKKRKFTEDTEISSQDISHVEKKIGSFDTRVVSLDVDQPKDELSFLHNSQNGNQESTTKYENPHSSLLHMPIAHNNKFSSLDLILSHKNMCISSEQTIEESQSMHPLKSSLSYRCSKCPSLTFRGKNDLRRHLYVHSGRKPFTCEVCGRGFIRRDHKIKHQLKHHLMKNKNIEKLYDVDAMNMIKNIDNDDSIDSNIDLVPTTNHNDNDNNNNNNDNNSNDNYDHILQDNESSQLDSEFDENGCDINIREHCRSEINLSDTESVVISQNGNSSERKTHNNNESETKTQKNNELERKTQITNESERKTQNNNELEKKTQDNNELERKVQNNNVSEKETQNSDEFERKTQNNNELERKTHNNRESERKAQKNYESEKKAQISNESESKTQNYNESEKKSQNSNETESKTQIVNELEWKIPDNNRYINSISLKFKETIKNVQVPNIGVNSEDFMEDEEGVNTNININFKASSIPKTNIEMNEKMNNKDFIVVDKNIETEMGIDFKEDVEAYKEVNRNIDDRSNFYDELESDPNKVVSANATNVLIPQALCKDDIVSQLKVLKYIQKEPELTLLTNVENI